MVEVTSAMLWYLFLRLFEATKYFFTLGLFFIDTHTFFYTKLFSTQSFLFLCLFLTFFELMDTLKVSSLYAFSALTSNELVIFCNT